MKKKPRPWTNKAGEVRELTDEFFRAARPFTDAELAAIGAPPRGRPKSANAKKLQSFKLSPDVIAGIKQGGAGYNARVEKVLRDALANGLL
jgi:uncharacterized protein (DUF4415 family)